MKNLLDYFVDDTRKLRISRHRFILPLGEPDVFSVAVFDLKAAERILADSLVLLRRSAEQEVGALPFSDWLAAGKGFWPPQVFWLRFSRLP